MKQTDLRIMLIQPGQPSFDPEKIYFTLVGQHGPVLGELQVLDENGTWYSVAIVADELKKRIVTQ
jgi:hypothetical protein